MRYRKHDSVMVQMSTQWILYTRQGDMVYRGTEQQCNEYVQYSGYHPHVIRIKTKDTCVVAKRQVIHGVAVVENNLNDNWYM